MADYSGYLNDDYLRYTVHDLYTKYGSNGQALTKKQVEKLIYDITGNRAGTAIRLKGGYDWAASEAMSKMDGYGGTRNNLLEENELIEYFCRHTGMTREQVERCDVGELCHYIDVHENGGNARKAEAYLHTQSEEALRRFKILYKALTGDKEAQGIIGNIVTDAVDKTAVQPVKAFGLLGKTGYDLVTNATSSIFTKKQK